MPVDRFTSFLSPGLCNGKALNRRDIRCKGGSRTAPAEKSVIVTTYGHFLIALLVLRDPVVVHPLEKRTFHHICE